MKNNLEKIMGLRIGYAITGSFCTFSDSFESAQRLRELGAELIPIMSENAISMDTKFGKAADHKKRLEEICGRKIISSIVGAEPIGPQNMCDIMVVAPCTGNTMAKLANSITDTAVVN